MSWRDRYVQGSYRGVSFLMTDTQATVGQRKSLYETPFSDGDSTGVSLGRRARRFRLSVMVIGADYDRARDELVEAFEKPGPGLLVHPSWGSMLVEVGPEIMVNESNDLGGMATISIDATETKGSTRGPVATIDTKSTVTARAEAVRTAARVAIGRDFSLQDIRDFAANANLETVDQLIRDLQEVNSTISIAQAVPGNYAHQIEVIADQTITLLLSPKELFDQLTDAMGLVFRSTTKVGSTLADSVRPEDELAAALDALRASSSALTISIAGAAELGTDVEPTVTTGNIGERRNHAALKHNLRAAALTHVAEAAIDATYDSAQRARNVRDSLTEALEDAAIVEIAGFEQDATTQTALQDLRAAVYAHLSSLELAQLAPVQAAEATSSLTLAYELYGDASRADEIEGLNLFPHPGFMFATIEALSE